MKNLLILVLLLFVSTSAFAKEFDQTHAKWGEVLSASVVVKGKKSEVNYDWVKANKRQLANYIFSLQDVSLRDYLSWNKKQQLAFLLNAYNAYTFKLILTKYPDLESIKDLGGFIYSPWKKEFFTLLGEIHSLDQIEHKWLRVKFKEPRLHFAIVCASIGCPALSPKPFVATTLDAQLEAAKTQFLSDKTHNSYDAKTSTLHLSKIFDWFEDDFVSQAGSVEAFVAGSITSDLAEQQKIKAKKVEIEYTDYDWSLNKVK